MTFLFGCVLVGLLILAVRATLGPFSPPWATFLVTWLFLAYGVFILWAACTLATMFAA